MADPLSKKVIGAGLPPVIEHERVGPAVARLIGAVHRDALELRPKPELLHGPIGRLAACVHSGHDDGHSDGGAKVDARIEERRKSLLGAWTRHHRTKLHEEIAFTRFGRRTEMA